MNTTSPEERAVCSRPGEPAIARSLATASSRPVATTAARYSHAERPVSSARPTSPSPNAGSRSTNSASWAAAARRPGAERADTTSGTATGASEAGTASEPTDASPAGASGACSRMTWALVPLNPNDDTPARRGRPVCGQARSSASSRTFPADQSTFDEGVSACRVRGNTPCRRARIILAIPATPAAACVCPMFDFTDPSHNGSLCSPRSP